MIRKSVGLDLDGVCYPWHEAVYDFYANFRNYTGTITNFWVDFQKTFTDADWEFLIGVDIFYSCIPVSQRIRQFLDSVSNIYDIYYISSRPKTVQLTTEQYLKRYNFPFRENLIFSDNKSSYARLLKLQYFVDDLPKQVSELSKVTDAILFARPYNKDEQARFKTAHSYNDIMHMMEIK